MGGGCDGLQLTNKNARKPVRHTDTLFIALECETRPSVFTRTVYMGSSGAASKPSRAMVKTCAVVQCRIAWNSNTLAFMTLAARAHIHGAAHAVVTASPFGELNGHSALGAVLTEHPFGPRFK